MTGGNPKVSVIIPFFSRKDWLAEAVDSVLRQTYKNHEIIIVNDGSQEDVTEFLQMYHGKIKYHHKENGGPGAARNFGIEKAAGEFLAFLDADDLWCAEKLEKQVALMESTDAVWSHTSYSLFQSQEPHRAYKRVDVADYQGMVFPRCLVSAPIATPCVMIRARILQENPALRFSEKMRYGQDGFLWMNLAVDHPLFAAAEDLAKVRIRGINAACRARTQLQVKAQSWEFISKNRSRYCGKGKADFWIRAAYRCCHGANRLVACLERKNFLNGYFAEAAAKILYFFPYGILKIYYYLKWA